MNDLMHTKMLYPWNLYRYHNKMHYDIPKNTDDIPNNK